LEDDANEAELVSIALRKLKRPTIFNVARTVAEAKQFIQKATELPGDPPQPDVVLIDVRLGIDSGLDFLQWCKVIPHCTRTRFIVFTGSAYPKDRIDAFKFGASAFETKPVSFEELVETMRRILMEWCA
jgi:CheY-like chemotaxis protein